MKYTTLKTVAMLSLFLMLTVGSVSAQSFGQIRVNIPFDFAAGKTHLKAGEYIVRSSSESILVFRTIHNVRNTFVFTPNKLRRPATNLSGTLVFHRYGSEYFLAEAWTSGDTNGRSVNKTGAERQLARQLARVKMQAQLVEITAELK
jgi:hypothetical protein